MANRYWVGGSGTWDAASTTNWSATSGGTTGASAPTSADDAFFDSNSGTSAVVDVTGSAVCRICTINKSDINLSLSGSPTFAATTTFTSGTLTIGSHTLTCFAFSTNNSNVRTLSFAPGGNITVTGNNVNVAAFNNANMTFAGNPIVNCTYSGSIGTRSISGNTGGISFNITAGTDAVATGNANGYASLDFTGFSGTLTNTVRYINGDLTLSPTMTVAAGSNRIEFFGTTGIQQITTNGLTLDIPLTFNGVGGSFAFQDALTQGSTRAFTVTNGTVKLKSGVTSTVGAFATSGTSQKFLESTLPGAQATLSQASGTVNASNLTIRDIAATGGATWNAPISAGNKDNTNNTGWNFFYRVMRPILRAVVGSIIQPVIRT